MRWLGCLLIVAVTFAFANAQDGVGGTRGKEKDKKKSAEKIGAPRKGLPLPPFTPEIEAAALAFAKEHYPELADLLGALKPHSKEDYQRGIGELYRTSERLAPLKQRDKERYELELEAWKVDSRIRMIVARISMQSDATQYKQELRGELLKKHDIELKKLVLERERAERRVKNLDTEIARRQAQRDQLADKDVDLLVNTVKNDKRAKRRPDVKKVDVKKVDATQVKVQNDNPQKNNKP
jgi:hypothetical protein